MRPIKAWHFAFLAAVVVLGGCSTNKGQIEGTKWSSQATSIKGVTIPAGSVRLEFHADGGLVYSIGPMIRHTGTYSFGLGSTVMLHLDEELSGRKDHAESVSVSANQLTMTDSDGTAITFNKAN